MTMTTKKEARKQELKEVLNEVVNSALFKEVLNDNKKEMSEKDAVNESLSYVVQDFNVKVDLPFYPKLAHLITEDVKEALINELPYRIHEVYDNLERSGKVTIGIELSDILENIYLELKGEL